MKTPKDKANELVEKYFWKAVKTKKQAIECAKIAVDEIINNSVMNYSGADVSDNEMLIDKEYWQEVKNELNKML